MRQTDTTKKCIKCARPKPLAEFYRNPKNSDGHDNTCKECARKNRIKNHQRKKRASVEEIKKLIRGNYAHANVWLGEEQVVRNGVWLGAEGKALLEEKVRKHIAWLRKHPKRASEEALV